MRHPLVRGLALALLLAAPSARADSAIDLNWNDCDLGGTPTVMTFGCTANTGASRFVVSFTAPDGITALGSVTARLRIQVPVLPCLTLDCASRATELYPSWWEFGAGGCREGGVQVVAPSGASACADPWESSDVVGAMTDFTAPGANTVGREMTVTITPTDGGAHALEAGVEYSAMEVRINHVHTTGAGLCAGCAQPMWLILEEVDLQMNDGSPTVALTRLAHRNGLGWQGDAPVPARSATWGELKTRYR